MPKDFILYALFWRAFLLWPFLITRKYIVQFIVQFILHFILHSLGIIISFWLVIKHGIQQTTEHKLHKYRTFGCYRVSFISHTPICVCERSALTNITA